MDMEKWAKQQKKAQRAAQKQARLEQMQQMQSVQQMTGVGVPQSAAVEQPGTATPDQGKELAEQLAMERARATIDAAAAQAQAQAQAQAPGAQAAQGVPERDASAAAYALDTAPDLMSLGTNYATCGQLLLNGKPIVMSGGGKWGCVVSRRQFGSEEQLRSHIQMSTLYKDALQVAITAGKIDLREREDEDV